MYERILVPTDGSEGSMAAVDEALGLAAAFDAEVHALYVVQTDLGPDPELTGLYEAFEEAGQEAVDAVVERAEAAGVGAVEASVAQGTPHRAILDYADDHGVDLIVMGTHGRTGLDRYLIGSVTEKVVRTAAVPVLTVSLPDAD